MSSTSFSTTPSLPPAPRDFDIHRAHVIEHISTRSLADKHDLSQTRIRQLVYRVNAFLAATLPIRSELEQQQEVQLAQHLAAGQLQHQIEQLQVFWNATSDPKYLRQQNRAILALARLGIVPGALDALAADCDCGIGVSPVVTPEGHASAGKGDPGAPGAEPSRAAADAPPAANLQFAITNSQSAITPPPPSRACSPSAASPPLPLSPSSPPPALTTSQSIDSGDPTSAGETDLQALNFFEERLLTLLDSTSPDDLPKREGLESTLRQTRAQQAALAIDVSPDRPGANIQHSTHQTSHSSPPTSVSCALSPAP